MTMLVFSAIMRLGMRKAFRVIRRERDGMAAGVLSAGCGSRVSAVTVSLGHQGAAPWLRGADTRSRGRGT